MRAYKATNKNMQCCGFQFEMNKAFIHDGELIPCESGFHFCKELKNVFGYYIFSPNNKFFEVEIPDDATVIDNNDKSVTNKIKFIRELFLAEIKELTNEKVYLDTDGGWITNNNKSFYNENGKLHCVDGPARIWIDDRQEWYRNGLRHRKDGPAVIDGGYQVWYQNGKLHRKDGPAVIDADGYQAWWKNGVFIK